MTLKKLTAVVFFVFFAEMSAPLAKDVGLKVITARGSVRCGTDLSTPAFAYKDENKVWRGIDADLCRLFALATLGDSDRFTLVDTPVSKMSEALTLGKIDIMFGNTSLSAGAEIKNKVSAISPLYYEKQMFLAHPVENATSMEDYKGSTVCVVRHSDDKDNVSDFSRKYNLELKILPFDDLLAARTAFYLKRCTLFSSSEVYLRGVSEGVVANKLPVEILPEIISYHPVYAYVDNSNPTLQIIAKWIYNAPLLAEAHGITSKNTDTFIGITEQSLKNLLGIDTKLWNAYGADPKWVVKAVKEFGNYGEIYERNLGKYSRLKIERDKNRLVEDGGMMLPKPFL